VDLLLQLQRAARIKALAEALEGISEIEEQAKGELLTPELLRTVCDRVDALLARRDRWLGENLRCVAEELKGRDDEEGILVIGIVGKTAEGATIADYVNAIVAAN
jgi:hypothetical protein